MHSKSVLPAVVAILAILSTTAACPAGSAINGDVCAFCPPGTFALAEDASCTPCAPGFWAPINSVSADACYPIAARMAAQGDHEDDHHAPSAARTHRPNPDHGDGEDREGSADSGSGSADSEDESNEHNEHNSPSAAPTSGVPAIGCDAGSAPAGDVCAFCPPGTFALAASSSCTPCPDGFWAPINSVSPDACYPIAAAATMGKAKPAPIHCDAGSAPVKGVCTFCPVGSYALAGATQCTKCPTGFSAPINSVSKDACYPLPAAMGKGKPAPIHCDAGSAPVKGVCTFCPVGTYALAGATQCTHCATGFWAPINSVGPDACYPLPKAAAAAGKPIIHCDAGSAPVKGVCTFCPVGTFALAGESACTKCLKGQWAPINSVSQDACYPLVGETDGCSAGSAPQKGVCTFCPKGTYALANAKKCTPCPEDHTAPINSVSKDACYLE